MRILLLCTSFNSLSQRTHVKLRELGHDVSVEFDINDAVTRTAIDLFKPDVLLAPFLRRRIPDDVTTRVPTMIVHPGPPGDRGPNALDWAILNGESHWGVTVIAANDKLDGGDLWSWRSFALRTATKSSLYRGEVGDAAIAAVCEALLAFENGGQPVPVKDIVADGGRWQPAVTLADRTIDWDVDDTATVLRKIRASDGQPGAPAQILGKSFHVYDAHLADW